MNGNHHQSVRLKSTKMWANTICIKEAIIVPNRIKAESDIPPSFPPFRWDLHHWFPLPACQDLTVTTATDVCCHPGPHPQLASTTSNLPPKTHSSLVKHYVNAPAVILVPPSPLRNVSPNPLLTSPAKNPFKLTAYLKRGS